MTVASGSATAQFTATAGTIRADQTAIVTASYNGSSQTVNVALTAPTMVNLLSCAPSSLLSGVSSACTVTLSKAAGSGGAAVSLSSSLAALTVPATVTVASGSASGQFTATAGTISANQTAIVTASYNGSSQTVNVALTAPTMVNLLSCAPSSLLSGVSSACTVTLSKAAGSGGAAVSLSSSLAALTVPATVTVASGSASGQFTATAGTISANQTAIVTASYNGSSQVVSLSLTLLWAQTSLNVTSGTPYVVIPATAPYTTLGAVAQPLRWEFRIHDFGAGASGNIVWATTYRPVLYPTYSFVGAQATPDTIADSGIVLNGCCAGRTDVSVRIQRDIVNGMMTTEVCDTSTGSNCITGTKTITAHNSDSLAGLEIDLWAGESIAYLRWYSTVVPVGTAIKPTGTGDLGDWEFEGNLNDSSSNNLTIGLNGATVSYPTTPTYVPICSAGTSQSVRAGQTLSLDGTGSYGFGSGMTYAWTQTSGPTVSITGANTATPSVAAIPAGSYTFSLTVTDTGGTTACTVNDGAVTTDSSGVVVTGNPTVDTLLGPMIQYGKNPWPWFDDRSKYDADLIIASLGTVLNASRNYAAFWLTTEGPGTITVTTGSATITGVGTTFESTFCGSTPGAYNLLVWYPDSSTEGYGLRGMVVDHCTSDTQLTLTTTWQADVADCHLGGCNYSSDYQVNFGAAGGIIWTYQGEGSNYYDAVAGLYAMYYRSGIIDYLTAARTLADRFWKYRLGSGTLCDSAPGPNQCGGSNAPREQSLIGMVLRASDGRSDMWTGLDKLFDYYMYFLNVYDQQTVWGLWDIREEAYHMAMVSYCALYNPDATYRANCKLALSSAMNGLWSVTQHSDGSWQQLYFEGYNVALGMTCLSSWSCDGGTATVSLTHGSTAVVGNTGINWGSGEFPNHIVFLPTSAAPANYEAQEATYYSPTFSDSAHLILDRPYEGTTGTHGWMLGYNPGGTIVTGWAAQPFIQGILGLAFDFTAKALAVSDPANAALAHTYNVSIANWEKNAGYRPAMKGMEYIVGSVECLPPVPEGSLWCHAGDGGGDMTPSQARTLSAESLRSVMTAYTYNLNPALLAFGNTLYNAMYCPAGSTACTSDGDYLTDLDSSSGWFVTGDPVNNKWHKYFGMLFGIGAGSDWPAYRIGGASPSVGRPIRVAFDMANVPGAAAVRVTTIVPNGEQVETSCASSPCTVAIDARQGADIFRLEYLAAGGAVLASTALH